MRRNIFSVMFLLVFLLMLAACGGQSSMSSSSMNMGTATPSTQTSNVGAKVSTVYISETDYKIASSLQRFVVGDTYHFSVKNAGKVAHEFMIMPSAMAMGGTSMSDMDKQAVVHISNLNPGETKTVDYTFPSSSAGSHPEFACHLPGHYEAGMKLDVTVSGS